MSAAAWLIRIIPGGAAERFGMFLGRLAFKTSGKYRARTLSNLRMCFPEMSGEERTTLAVKVFEHFGKTFVRFFREDKLSEEQIIASVELRGEEALKDAFETGKGVLMITAHFGNWERMAHVLTLKGYKLSVVARDANALRTTEMVNRMRGKAGLDVFSRGKAAREILRRLADNEAVGILVDQNTREILVPFFGIPAGTNEGPAAIHLRTGSPIMMSFCFEKPDGTYCIELSRLDTGGATGDRKADIERIMTQVNDCIEKYVRAHPEQWLWMHDRWRWARELGLTPKHD